MVSNMFATSELYGGVCVELSTRLRELGWQVTTTSSLTNRMLRPIDMIVTAWRARNQYHVAQIDVFSGAAFRWAELSVFLLKRIHKPVVLTLHGGNLPEFSQHNERRLKNLLNSADHVTAPSHYLLEKLKVYRSDIQLLPNPIDISKYPYRVRTSPSARILYLRALHRIYNPLLAIRTLDVLRSNEIKASLAIVGPDKGDGTLEKLQQLIDDFEIVDQVSLVGAIPKFEVPTRMSEYDIFINTTNVDNTPVSVIEAMASGLCIVSTNVGGIPYLLTHEHDALLVPPNDPEAMAAAVRRILTDPGLAERLSRNARATAEQFDWVHILPQWEDLLTQVINEHKNG
jgi:glycosyltransferase involved in cell wall biosynthesis